MGRTVTENSNLPAITYVTENNIESSFASVESVYSKLTLLIIYGKLNHLPAHRLLVLLLLLVRHLAGSFLNQIEIHSTVLGFSKEAPFKFR